MKYSEPQTLLLAEDSWAVAWVSLDDCDYEWDLCTPHANVTIFDPKKALVGRVLKHLQGRPEGFSRSLRKALLTSSFFIYNNLQ